MLEKDNSNFNYIYIQNTLELNKSLDLLQDKKIFFIDTEFVNNKNCDELCLLQISDGENCLVIDTLKLNDTAKLASTIASKGSVWIIHACYEDLRYLINYLNIDSLPKIFDTQIAWGMNNAETYISLSYLVATLLNIKIEKKYQAIDWTSRPLNKEYLDYAAGDVKHLPEIYKLLNEELIRNNKSHIFESVMDDFLHNWKFKTNSSKRISNSNFKNLWELDYMGYAALQFLIEWYNNLSRDIQKTVPKPHILFNIAKALPQCADDLKKIQGIPFKFIKEKGDSFTGKIIMATYNANPEDFNEIKPNPQKSFYEKKVENIIKLAFSKISHDLKISIDIIYNDFICKEMIKLACKNNSIEKCEDALDGWRKEYLKDDFIRILKKIEQIID
tara:strand:+ start:563 stop:1726 length:1164 start_codon:yes stop_codon:yes gene_type:complete